MITITHRIWISFVLIIGAGISLSVLISTVGDKAAQSSSDLVYKQLPRLSLIKSLRSHMSEHERLLYELYATTDGKTLLPQIEDANTGIVDSMLALNQVFEDEIVELPDLYMAINTLSEQHQKNMSSTRPDWDLARQNLSGLTLRGKEVEVILLNMTNVIAQDAWREAEESTDLIETMVTLVVGYAIVVIVISAFVAFYARSILKDRAQRRTLAMFPERNPSPVLSLNWQGEIRYANPATRSLLEQFKLPQDQPDSLLPDTFADDLSHWQKNQATQVEFTHELIGHILHFNVSLFRDLESIHIYVEDISERIKNQNNLEYQANHDTLTGLANRRRFEQILETQVSDKRPCALMLISMDRFKLITSSQGYSIGDGLILSMGQRLRMLCMQADTDIQLFRLEAAAFCMLIEGDDLEMTTQLANHLRNQMDYPLEVNNHKFYLSVSVGICQFPKDGETGDQLISNVHSALHHSKRTGDSIELYEARFHSEEQSWLPIETALRDAISNNELFLVYQAKVDSQTTAVKGAEALIRWQKSDGDMVSPGQFIPIAEQTGLIIRIGEWIIEQACLQSVAFNEKHSGINLAINISARQFQNRYFLERLQNIVDKTGANPSVIELEITEGLIMENVEQSIKIMQQLKNMGFALAIDDFGTGYSSLTYLKRFPVDTLKVDQAFVRNLENDEKDRSIIRNIIDLAKALNLKTVAEGVETKGQWQFLRGLHCDYIQGYYFSKPGKPEDLFKSP